jgi:hypothetical protein
LIRKDNFDRTSYLDREKYRFSHPNPGKIFGWPFLGLEKCSLNFNYDEIAAMEPQLDRHRRLQYVFDGKRYRKIQYD